MPLCSLLNSPALLQDPQQPALTLTSDQIQKLPQLHACDRLTFGAELAKALGLDLAIAVNRLFPHTGESAPQIVDMKTHMLMKGHYPCITSEEDTACSEEDLWAGTIRSEDSEDMIEYGFDLCPRCLAAK